MFTTENIAREMERQGIASFAVTQPMVDVFNQLLIHERKQIADACREIGFKHQQTEGPYAAGKKAGAFECADSIDANTAAS